MRAQRILQLLGRIAASPVSRKAPPFLDPLEFRLLLATFTVTTTSDAGAGSLREAIVQANASPDAGGAADRIEFDIAGDGAQTIVPLSALPASTGRLVIDGTSQPGFSGTPLIELSGVGAGALADGLRLIGGNSIVQGLAINAFKGNGVYISGPGATQLLGNMIGTDAGGTERLPNGLAGVLIEDSGHNLVGGSSAASRNVISANTGDGVRISGAASTMNLVLGNFIGVDSGGNAGLGNGAAGVAIVGAQRSGVGGTASGQGNVISANTGEGVVITESSAVENQIVGNRIGVGADADVPLGNGLPGVGITQGASNSDIADNVIGFNLFGIAVEPNAGNNSINNAFRRNRIFSNDVLGIDLDANGPTDNDADDADGGANGRLNFPAITDVISGDTSVEIKGTYRGTPGVGLVLDFFVSDVAHSSGFGEAQLYLGSVNITTDGTGRASFDATFDNQFVADGQVVTATATRDGVGTSEFSEAFVAGMMQAFSDLQGTAPEATAGSAFDGVVATFAPGDGTSAEEFLATIDWGDRSAPDLGTIATGENGRLAVTGTHTYAEAGTFAVTIELTHLSGQHDSVTVSAEVAEDTTPTGLSATAVNVAAVAGVRGGRITLARFTDDLASGRGPAALRYQASIDWGDGEHGRGRIIPIKGGAFEIVGRHPYRHPGVFPIEIVLTAPLGGKTRQLIVGSMALAVSAPRLLESKHVPVEASARRLLKRPLIAFFDSNAYTNPGDYDAEIDWGDGVSSAGKVREFLPGHFRVGGQHAYAQAGTFQARVRITDETGETILYRRRVVVKVAKHA